jgi:hypothetical protein
VVTLFSFLIDGNSEQSNYSGIVATKGNTNGEITPTVIQPIRPAAGVLTAWRHFLWQPILSIKDATIRRIEGWRL